MSLVKLLIFIIGCGFYKMRKVVDYAIRQYETTLLKSFGRNSYISSGCIFTYKTVTIGNNTYIGKNCVIQSAHGEIKIGNNVMFGPGVHIHGGNHEIHKIGMLIKEVHKQPNTDGTIIIGDDVWVGSNSIILKDVILGEGCVIGAGSVVTKNIPPYAIAVGNPAHIVKYRFNEDELKQHLSLLNKREIKD